MANRIRHFIGVESSEQLAFIDELHALGLSSTIELPELIVVGDQSTGKSSVLQAITEISFPVQERTCTRFPIQISFRQTKASKDVGVKATITPGPMTGSDNAFLERTEDFRIEVEALTQDAMKEMIEKATEAMFGKDHAQADSLCDATLRIERSGPDEMHWSIVDLPGLVQNTQAKAKDNARTNGTTKNGTMLILGDTDVELSKSLEIVATVPGIESRAIGVLNKCDKREEGAGMWMDSLLQNNLSTAPHLDHGWFGLRNRKPHEPHFTDAERDEAEEQEFSKPVWQNVPKARFGIKALMDYIDRERRTQLQKGMPSIIAEIRQKLRDCEADLKKMGEARTSPRSQRYFVLQFCNEMQRMADACLRGHYHDVASQDPKVRLCYLVQRRLDEFAKAVHPTRDVELKFDSHEIELQQLARTHPHTWDKCIRETPGIYSAIYQEAMISRGKSLPGSVHPDVEEKVFRKLSAHWEAFASDLVEDAKLRVRECYDILLRLAIPNNRVRLEVSRLVSGHLEDWNKDSDTALQELVEDNQVRPLFTKHPFFENQLATLEQRRNFILNGTQPVEAATNGSINKQTAHLPTLLNNIIQTRAKLEIYYQIAVYRFIDNVATQVIERHVLGPKCPLRTVSAETFTQLDDDELNRVAAEDKSDASTRKRLEATRDRYRKALERWEQISVL
ncbi:putative dynamin family GTPase [Aspergillus undulatus]|uniref:putative dynamin family GTPase n=1 Tax=Aspergillus undulatus TaxID=1810928 RepID=UPI003CCD92C8